MNNVWKKNNQYISAVVILSALWLSVQFGVAPVISLIQQKSNLIEEKTLDRENREKRIQELPKLREQSAQLLEEENNFMILVKKEEELGLIEVIEKIAEETDNKINIEIQNPAKMDTSNKKSKDADKEKKDENILKPANENYLAVGISINGTYNSLIQFIKKIENMKYWSDIINIDTTFEEVAQESRSGDVFTPGINQNTKGEEIMIKNLATKLTIVFYRE
jgi:hypothetical protein